MFVAVEHRIDLLEGAGPDVLVAVAVLEQCPGVLRHLYRRGAQFGGPHLHIGCMQPIGGARMYCNALMRLDLPLAFAP
jgi:hypothetical protein